MRLLDTNTRFLNNKSFGMSQINNTWGCLINTLDMCLVTGTPEQPIISIITIEDPEDPSYWLSTLLLNVGHAFEKDYSVIEIKGAIDTAYNTLHRVQESNLTTIKIAFSKETHPEKPKDSLPTEILSAKLAPLGYIKAFEAPQKAAYKSSNPDNPRGYLRVDNSCPVGFDPTWNKFARVSMFSDMESIDDYKTRPGRLKAPFYPEDPYRAEEQKGSGATGSYGESKWYYSINAALYPVEGQGVSHGGPFTFELIGDDRTFYLIISLRGYDQYWENVGYCFGEYTNLSTSSSGDFSFILVSHEFNQPANSPIFPYNGNPGGAESYSAFGRANNSWGKYFFDSSYEGSVTSKHVKGSFFSLLIGYYSGIDTGFSFNKYYTELNFVEVYIRLFYSRATVLGGKMRGYYFVGGNINLDTTFHLTPKLKDIFETTLLDGSKAKLGLFHIFRSLDTNTFNDMPIAFKLNNWE